jgi:hypothetical protein
MLPKCPPWQCSQIYNSLLNDDPSNEPNFAPSRWTVPLKIERCGVTYPMLSLSKPPDPLSYLLMFNCVCLQTEYQTEQFSDENPLTELLRFNCVCLQTENQTEEFSDENKSIVWFLVKQVRNIHIFSLNLMQKKNAKIFVKSYHVTKLKNEVELRRQNSDSYF